MNDEMIQRAKVLLESVEKHSPEVQRRIKAAGFKASPLLVFSIAKYWDALERLAAE